MHSIEAAMQPALHSQKSTPCIPPESLTRGQARGHGHGRLAFRGRIRHLTSSFFAVLDADLTITTCTQIYCQTETTTQELNGVDLMGDTTWKCTVEAVRDAMVLVRCGEDTNTEAEWLSERCCEPYEGTGDAPVYDAGEGLHYSVYREPEPNHRAMRIVATRLAAQGDIPRAPMLFLHRNSAFRLAPNRVIQSKLYGDRVYRCINRRLTMAVDDKRCLSFRRMHTTGS
jgi:hypothetical protein